MPNYVNTFLAVMVICARIFDDVSSATLIAIFWIAVNVAVAAKVLVEGNERVKNGRR